MLTEITQDRRAPAPKLSERFDERSAAFPDVSNIPLPVATTASAARREAQPDLRHRDVILGKVAHELRNPLSTILMTTGFVLESLLPEPCSALRQHMEATRRAATLMARLVDDLLEGATLASGRLVLVRTPLRAKDLFVSASTLLGPLAEARHIALAFIDDETSPPFSADEGRLLQVLANLVGNAIKFTETGGHITVSAHAGAHCVSFRVADSGRGIAADDIPQVFDQFWQGPGSRHHGVGLGLAIAREIVDAHGGRIDVTSSVGHGSVFVFTIPL